MTEEAKPDPIKFGKIIFTGKDINPEEALFDRISIGSRGELLVLSVITASQSVKAIRSHLSGASKVSIVARDVEVAKPGAATWDKRQPGSLTAVEGGYNADYVRFDYGMVHALFIAKTPGFMNVVTEESLWNELNDSRFTTPIVKEWMPYVSKSLKDRGLLSLCQSYRCECGVLTAATSDLDDIVEKGLKARSIYIPDPGVIDTEVVNAAERCAVA